MCVNVVIFIRVSVRLEPQRSYSAGTKLLLSRPSVQQLCCSYFFFAAKARPLFCARDCIMPWLGCCHLATVATSSGVVVMQWQRGICSYSTLRAKCLFQSIQYLNFVLYCTISNEAVPFLASSNVNNSSASNPIVVSIAQYKRKRYHHSFKTIKGLFIRLIHLCQCRSRLRKTQRWENRVYFRL